MHFVCTCESWCEYSAVLIAANANFALSYYCNIYALLYLQHCFDVQQQLGESVVSLAGGGFHSTAVTASGRVFAWGFNRLVTDCYYTVKVLCDP
jgi:Regulator of chromosome condensation (RCC1) repeat